MALTVVTKPIKFGDGSLGFGNFATDGTNFWQMPVLADSNGNPITDSSGIPVTSFSSGAITNPTSTMTRPANVTQYAANQLIGTSTDGATASLGVPSFAIATPGGAAIITRVRLWTSAIAGWGGVSVSINLWSAHPTYVSGAHGDGGAYSVSVGSGTWLANAIVTFTQFGDGAVGASQLTGTNEMGLDLASGTAVFWDTQILAVATPFSGQTFKLTAELMN